MSLKKFLTKHSGELAKVASVLGAVVSALPIDRQDKRNLGGMIGDLADAASSIGKSAKKMSSVDVTLDKKAIKEAIAEMLPDLLGDIAERVFQISTKHTGEPAKLDPPAKPARGASRKRTAPKASK